MVDSKRRFERLTRIWRLRRGGGQVLSRMNFTFVFNFHMETEKKRRWTSPLMCRQLLDAFGKKDHFSPNHLTEWDASRLRHLYCTKVS